MKKNYNRESYGKYSGMGVPRPPAAAVVRAGRSARCVRGARGARRAGGRAAGPRAPRCGAARPG